MMVHRRRKVVGAVGAGIAPTHTCFVHARLEPRTQSIKNCRIDDATNDLSPVWNDYFSQTAKTEQMKVRANFTFVRPRQKETKARRDRKKATEFCDRDVCRR